jgi:hypothetical protein
MQILLLVEFEYDPDKSLGNSRSHHMNETDKDNLERRFDAGESVLEYFETDVVLNTDRLADLSAILNLSAVAREAGINVQTLQAKIRRRSPLSADETRRIVAVLKRHHLETVA